MSAPEPQVRVTTYYDAACDGCHQVRSHSVESDVREWAESHEAECVPLRLARLQARCARNETLRALIERWRAEAFEDARDAQATAIERCADELERAIGDSDA